MRPTLTDLFPLALITFAADATPTVVLIGVALPDVESAFSVHLVSKEGLENKLDKTHAALAPKF